MKHHFADLLYREDEYWTIVPKGYTEEETSWSAYYQKNSNNGDIYFLGKGSRTIKSTASNAAEKKEAAVKQFEIYEREAEETLKPYLL
ncbi:hypothetical protein [Chryseobacterium sp. ERMR1:04]|uniref:hypothetical protein n=1 Tax=Chryseobacterium sp. ERMR1:04 TaxID=1705393 RepID=UPI0006C89E7D|nr:hypothetical protein [Chryseobacterium sp. ERMR1:04]KPH14189.1 hypothetical protein AMQ68_01280 [Chryseobacterium sp. ERMR1:04]